jgi:hypothetical protein
MKKNFRLLIPILTMAAMITTFGCSSNSGNPSDSLGQSPPKADVDFVCTVTTADQATRACLTNRTDDQRAKIVATMRAWVDSSGTFIQYIIERKSFQTRYEISEIEVQCLKTKLCKERTREKAN